MTLDAPWTDFWYTSADGLKLYARDYGRRDAAAPPVICLPGLARSSADFHELASALATDTEHPCRVLALDYRGRGRSDRDPDPKKYDLAVENTDVQALLAATGIKRAVFIGTSRGGMHAMLLAATRKGAIAAAVLNDIGPVIEMAGLLRIKTYVGRLPAPRSFEEAALVLKAAMAGSFPAFSDADWKRLARRSFVERNGALEADYDPALTSALEALSPDRPLPPLWPFFDALEDVPLLAIRGERSDILSEETLATMRARRPDMETLIVPGQGHAPVLWEDEVIRVIAGFIEQSASDKDR